MPETTTQAELLAKIAELAADKTVNGILVQLPLPKQIDERAVIDAIPPEKDVDGFSPVNVGRMQTGQPCFLPCTPAGCIRNDRILPAPKLTAKTPWSSAVPTLWASPQPCCCWLKMQPLRSAIPTRPT